MSSEGGGVVARSVAAKMNNNLTHTVR